MKWLILPFQITQNAWISYWPSIFSHLETIVFCTQVSDGLILEKTSSPLGVLLIVFESRPDALVQVSRNCLLRIKVLSPFGAYNPDFSL